MVFALTSSSTAPDSASLLRADSSIVLSPYSQTGFVKNNLSNIENALNNKLCSLALLFVLFVTFDLCHRLFHKVVTPPKTEEELAALTRIYDMLGMTGAFGSTDCTHIPLGKCPVSWKNSCIGKEGFPTLAYSMTCDHTRRIMACSGGFPGSYNDKTIARYDSLICDVADNPLFTEFSYNVQSDAGVLPRKGKHAPAALLAPPMQQHDVCRCPPNL